MGGYGSDQEKEGSFSSKSDELHVWTKLGAAKGLAIMETDFTEQRRTPLKSAELLCKTIMLSTSHPRYTRESDGGGFEPPVPFGTHAFQACTIDRSVTHPLERPQL